MSSTKKVFFFTLVLFLCLSGCELSSQSEAIGPSRDISESIENGTAIQYHYGTPEGERVLLPAGGIYTADQANDPVVMETKAALAVAGMRMANFAVESETWQEAHSKVQAYLASPPEEALGVPDYLLEQAAAQAMYHHRFGLRGSTDISDSSEKTEAAALYLEMLLRNRFPDPVPVADLLSEVQGYWSPERTSAAAQQALVARQIHQDAIDSALADTSCPKCVERQFGMQTARADRAVMHLTALAQAATPASE